MIEQEHGFDWLNPLPINPKLDSLQVYKGADTFVEIFTTLPCKPCGRLIACSRNLVTPRSTCNQADNPFACTAAVESMLQAM